MSDNPLLDEIHRVREELAERFNYDLKAICQYLREQQNLSGAPTVTRSPKRATPRSVRTQRDAVS